jgi:hypothetical protein
MLEKTPQVYDNLLHTYKLTVLQTNTEKYSTSLQVLFCYIINFYVPELSADWNAVVSKYNLFPAEWNVVMHMGGLIRNLVPQSYSMGPP